MRAEAVELLDLAIDAIRHVPLPLESGFEEVPLWVHASYSREELLAGMGHATLERTPASDMQGVRFVEALRTDVLTFTLQKAEADYSPTTMYKDYAMAPDLVHWETQSTTSDTSPTGRRYLTQRETGTHVSYSPARRATTRSAPVPMSSSGPPRTSRTKEAARSPSPGGWTIRCRPTSTRKLVSWPDNTQSELLAI